VAERTLRTIVYVDGFNFYYGTMRGTLWKWLDLQAFIGNLLAPRKSYSILISNNLPARSLR
jgi:6-hydroxy-3-succinoylpyridine 3-monooxygenase